MVENESRTLRCSMTRFGLQSVDVVVTRLTLLLAFHNDNMVISRDAVGNSGLQHLYIILGHN